MTSITIVKLNKVLSISWPLIRLATDIINQIKLNESLLSLFFNSENFMLSGRTLPITNAIGITARAGRNIALHPKSVRSGVAIKEAKNHPSG